MGYTLTTLAYRADSSTPENRVWGLPSVFVRLNAVPGPQPAQPSRKIRPTATKSASGIPYWPSRDPIGEIGWKLLNGGDESDDNVASSDSDLELLDFGNLYGFLDNDGISMVDVLGLADIDLIPDKQRKSRNDQGCGEIKSPPGTFSVEGHGNFSIMGDKSEKPLTPEDVAKLIRKDPHYKKGMAVYLYSCEVGKGNNSFAQRLSTLMKVDVYAPTEICWIETGGKYEICGCKSERYGFLHLSKREVKDRSLPGKLEHFRPKRLPKKT